MFSSFMPQDYMKGFYTPELFVDAFQETKRYLTNKIIIDPVLNRAANNYINSQTQFAKMLIENGINISKHSTNSIVNYWISSKS